MRRFYRMISALLAALLVLSGAAFAEQEAPVQARLTVSNVTLKVAGETFTLNPTLNIGVDIQPQGGLLAELYIESDGEKLFPTQLSFNQDDGIAARFINADAAIRVTGAALESARQLMQENMAGIADGEEGEVLRALQELIPAYMDYVKAMTDPQTQERMREAANAAMIEAIGEVEETPAQFEINGVAYDGVASKVTLDYSDIRAIVDALIDAVPEMKTYFDKTNAVYLPLMAEAGFDGMESVMDIYDEMSMAFTVEVDGQATEDGGAVLADIVVTLYKAETDEETQADMQIPDFDPMKVYMHVEQAPDYNFATANFDYAIEDVTMAMNMAASQQPGDESVEMMMNVSEADQSVMSMAFTMSAVTDEADETLYKALLTVDAQEAGDVALAMNLEGAVHADKSGEGSFELDVMEYGEESGLSFDYACEPAVIEDLISGFEAFELDNLDQETLEGLSSDPKVFALLMKIGGSLTEDAGKLTGEESVAALIERFAYTSEDYSTEYSEYVPEDDGVLAYNEPAFGWLPEGWALENMDIETAYDTVNAQLTSEEGSTMYAYFSSSYADAPVNYTVSDSGEIAPTGGRVISVSGSPEDGYMYGHFEENGVLVSLYAYSDTLTLDDFAQILASITL